MEINKNELKEKRKEEANDIQKIECRMYEKRFPVVEDLVMVGILLSI
jgi:hypothetical protein